MSLFYIVVTFLSLVFPVQRRNLVYLRERESPRKP